MIAVDTNLLVHAHQRESELHPSAQRMVRHLAESPSPWVICFHSLVEFYAVATHPRLWKQPSTPAQAWDQIAAWRESPSLRIITDTDDVLNCLEKLATSARVRGGQIHDARIAACCLTCGASELWTIDRDFSRYPGLKTRNPLASK
ncbi:MAG TPA: PIN domain-containing protein [Kiritimatiellia bacterium]|nr:PIN domain-containing protein [Kiritimatiellia bacterium]